MISGIYFVLRAGLPWRDLPKEFGPWSSVYTRFRRWCRSGLWSKMLAMLSAEPCGSIRSVDCTHIKVHQDASNAAGGADAQAVGKTKGGSNTKLAAVVDGLGRATGLRLAAGNRNDLRVITALIDKLADCWVVGDRGFDAGSFPSMNSPQPASPGRARRRRTTWITSRSTAGKSGRGRCAGMGRT